MKLILKIIFFLLLTFFMVEMGLRARAAYSAKYAPGNEQGIGFQAKAMDTFVQKQINRLWSRKIEDRKTFLEPPFPVFVNKGFEDSNRLEFIQKFASLPKSQVTTAENFLRLNKPGSNSAYTVTSNSLGFRGVEREKVKPKNTFRIIVLGSYPAFGHAVNDNETYSFILEENLKKKYAGKRNIEVWNGGKLGTTSIMGYARLKNEILEYSPDLIIWDYGWIELFLTSDKVPQNDSRLRLKTYSMLERSILDVCIQSYMQPLNLCNVMANKINKVSYADSIVGWKKSMTLLAQWSQENKIPIIFLRHQGVAIPASEYQKFDQPDKRFYFVDTSRSIEPLPTSDEMNSFWSQTNWMSELNYSQAETMQENPKLIFFGDAIQYNKLGYSRIGHFLSEYLIQHNLSF